MNRVAQSLLGAVLWVAVAAGLHAADWYVSTDGEPTGKGTRDAPWDLKSVLAGWHVAVGGDTIWVLGGTYKHLDRRPGSTGYAVGLAGEKDRPIVLRAVPGARVTIDGGLCIQPPASWLWLCDLEIIVSENFSLPRQFDQPGSSPSSYDRPWGGLIIASGERCKYINLIIHHNAQGISWWTDSTNSEVYGCIIYDNGWKAPDRGHGHAIYTQNQDGLKTVADCIMTGGYGFTMHAYGSARAYVDNYLVEGNIAYNAGEFLIGGGRPGRGIRVLNNFLYNVRLQIGYDAPENEDCEVRQNTVVGDQLEIVRFKHVVDEGNSVLSKGEPPQQAVKTRTVLRPNRYDPLLAHVAALNWSGTPVVDLAANSFLKPGDKYRLMNPRDFYGKPVGTGTFDGKPIPLPVEGEFAAFVLMKEPAPH